MTEKKLSQFVYSHKTGNISTALSFILIFHISNFFMNTVLLF